MKPLPALFFAFCLVYLPLQGISRAGVASGDSTKNKTISLDSLSAEDLELLEIYKDSFMHELNEIKAVMLRNKMKPLDTTVALMNRSSHMEIGLDFYSRALANGRDPGLRGVVFYPSATYYHRTGLYAAMGMGFYTDSTISHSARVPALFISPGFYRVFFKRWTFHTGYSRNIIFYGDKFQQGLLNNSFTLLNSYNFWDYITLSLNAGISWSSNLTSKKYFLFNLRKVSYEAITRQLGQAYSADILLSLRKDFSFYGILGSKVFTVSPEISFLFGHDNSVFVIRRIFRGYTFTYDGYFGFLNLEPGLRINWRIKNLDISAAFHYAIPFNQFDETRLTRVRNPRLYYPYAEVGIKYLFRIPKLRKQ